MIDCKNGPQGDGYRTCRPYVVVRKRSDISHVSHIMGLFGLCSALPCNRHNPQILTPAKRQPLQESSYIKLSSICNRDGFAAKISIDNLKLGLVNVAGIVDCEGRDWAMIGLSR
jgi:hypothetical protein